MVYKDSLHGKIRQWKSLADLARARFENAVSTHLVGVSGWKSESRADPPLIAFQEILANVLSSEEIR
jgi:hypothetical protein